TSCVRLLTLPYPAKSFPGTSLAVIVAVRAASPQIPAYGVRKACQPSRHSASSGFVDMCGEDGSGIGYWARAEDPLFGPARARTPPPASSLKATIDVTMKNGEIIPTSAARAM